MYLENNMRNIGIFGMGGTPIEVVKALKKKNIHNIIAIPDEIDGKQSWRESFRQYSRQEGIEFITLPDIKGESIVDYLKQKDIDLLISAHSEVLLPKSVIEYVGGEVFNIHFGLLPKCRGLFPTFWHIINGDKYAGVTLHKITPGIDVGDIIDQIKIPITQKTTNWSMYLECKKVSYQIIIKNIHKLINRTYVVKKQDEKKSTYYSKRSVNFAENFVNWNSSTFKVARFIQAFMFPPLQYPRTRHKKNAIQITKLIDYSLKIPKFAPGTILSRKNGICKIQTADGFCEVRLSSARVLTVGERVYY